MTLQVPFTPCAFSSGATPLEAFRVSRSTVDKYLLLLLKRWCIGKKCSEIVGKHKCFRIVWILFSTSTTISWAQITSRVVSRFLFFCRRFHLSLPRTLCTMRRNQYTFVGQRIVSSVWVLCKVKRSGSHCSRMATNTIDWLSSTAVRIGEWFVLHLHYSKKRIPSWSRKTLRVNSAYLLIWGTKEKYAPFKQDTR